MVGEGLTGGMVVRIARASTQVLRFLITKESALNCLVSAFLLLQRMASLRKPPVSSPFVCTAFWGLGGGRDDPFQKCSGLEVPELLCAVERLCVHLKQRHKEALLCGTGQRFRGL